jgi:hypothetical protein
VSAGESGSSAALWKKNRRPNTKNFTCAKINSALPVEKERREAARKISG